MRWFSAPMLSKYTCTMGVRDHFCPYTPSKFVEVVGGIFFTSFYNWAKIQIISTHGHWLHFHTLASLPGHVLSRQSAWITLHCCKSVQKHCWAKLHTFARIIAFCFIITIIKISPTLFSLVGSEFDPNGCENQLYENILIFCDVTNWSWRHILAKNRKMYKYLIFFCYKASEIYFIIK